MLLWFGMAVMAAAVTYAVARPLMRREITGESSLANTPSPDVAVYRDQLRELESDRERGLLSATEAEAARAEVGRRLIAAAATEPEVILLRANTARHAPVLQILLVGLPLTALGAYLFLGQPDLPSRPYADRLKAPLAQATPGDLIARVEAQLRSKPDDARGWDVIGPVYLQMGRYADAAEAFMNAMKYGAETPQRLAGFADARVGQENGIIPDDARRAYERVVVLAPDRFDARLRLAMAKEQDGKTADAIAEIKAMLAAAPKDVPWRSMVERRLKRMESGVVNN